MNKNNQSNDLYHILNTPHCFFTNNPIELFYEEWVSDNDADCESNLIYAIPIVKQNNEKYQLLNTEINYPNDLLGSFIEINHETLYQQYIEILTGGATNIKTTLKWNLVNYFNNESKIYNDTDFPLFTYLKDKLYLSNNNNQFITVSVDIQSNEIINNWLSGKLWCKINNEFKQLDAVFVDGNFLLEIVDDVHCNNENIYKFFRQNKQEQLKNIKITPYWQTGIFNPD